MCLKRNAKHCAQIDQVMHRKNKLTQGLETDQLFDPVFLQVGQAGQVVEGEDLGLKFMSCRPRVVSTNKPAPDWLYKSKQQIRSQVSKN